MQFISDLLVEMGSDFSPATVLILVVLGISIFLTLKIQRFLIELNNSISDNTKEHKKFKTDIEENNDKILSLEKRIEELEKQNTEKFFEIETKLTKILLILEMKNDK